MIRIPCVAFFVILVLLVVVVFVIPAWQKVPQRSQMDLWSTFADPTISVQKEQKAPQSSHMDLWSTFADPTMSVQNVSAKELFSSPMYNSRSQKSSCLVEALPTVYYEHKMLVANDGCDRQLPYQGNYTTPMDIAQHVSVPLLRWERAQPVMPAPTDILEEYWRREGEERTCSPCVTRSPSEMTTVGSRPRYHGVLQTARRWWAPVRWEGLKNSSEELILEKKGIRGSDRSVTFLFTDIASCVVTEFRMTLVVSRGGEVKVHFGLKDLHRSFRYSVALLVPTFHELCKWPDPLPPPYRYLPCITENEGPWMAKAKELNNVDTYGLRWNSVCSEKRPMSQDSCAQLRRKRLPIKDDAQKSPPLHVAVALSGFVRTFQHTKTYLYSYVVKPNNATLFMAAWNVLGRMKQGTNYGSALPKLSVGDMVKFLTEAMDPKLVNIGGVRVLDYLDQGLHRWLHDIFLSGFRRPGNYILTSLVLQMIPPKAFDVIIRTRFDMIPSVPLKVTRDPETSGGYVLRLPYACKIDGHWWPQFGLFDSNKIIKHFADTRFRFFTWQTCDWIEVGGAQAMKTFGRIFNWSVENVVNAYSQNVDFAFLADQGLAWQPMHLHVRILRRVPQKRQKKDKTGGSFG